jgi:hypothetical protein
VIFGAGEAWLRWAERRALGRATIPLHNAGPRKSSQPPAPADHRRGRFIPCPAAAGQTTDVDWEVGYVGSHWNNEISSFRNYASCWTKHFQNINFGGLFGPVPCPNGGSNYFCEDASSMPGFNDVTSSIQWT